MAGNVAVVAEWYSHKKVKEEIQILEWKENGEKESCRISKHFRTHCSV